MVKDTIVVDLDGTLADGRARYHLVKGKHRDYAEFHRRLGEDPVNLPIGKLVEAMAADYRIVLVSARPKWTRKATMAWLSKFDLPYHELNLLREDGDSTPDQELKRAWLYGYRKERVLFVLDDRQKVVDMWREEGLTCLQVADWKEKRPRFVYLPQDVRGDAPFFAGTVAPAGVYEAAVNPHGAVSVRATNGKMLGVKPSEFQDVQMVEAAEEVA